MSGHCHWLQTGAELGIPGLALLACFYGLCAARLWPLTRRRHPIADPWHHDAARMVFAGIVGFAVAAQFLTLSGMEAPYYVVLVGAVALKLSSPVRQAVEERQRLPIREFNPTTQPVVTYS
jgi:O-antigen ligase